MLLIPWRVFFFLLLVSVMDVGGALCVCVFLVSAAVQISHEEAIRAGGTTEIIVADVGGSWYQAPI